MSKYILPEDISWIIEKKQNLYEKLTQDCKYRFYNFSLVGLYLPSND